MSRRPVSPLRKSTLDPRDAMIRKLRDDITLAHGREQQVTILEHYLADLSEKMRNLQGECIKTEQQSKLKLQLTIKSLNELRKQAQVLRIELKSTHSELKDLEQKEQELTRALNGKAIEIQKHRKEGVFLREENEKLLDAQYRLKAQEDETIHDIRKTNETVKDLEGRIGELAKKTGEVKAYIHELTNVNNGCREKLKSYQHENNGIGSQLDEKQIKIDELEKGYAERHMEIKREVEMYIELEHENESFVKENNNKNNLLRIETQKYNELVNAKKKMQKKLGEYEKNIAGLKEESKELQGINTKYDKQIHQMKADLVKCQEHFENLLEHNSYIHEELGKILKEDELIIGVIRKKKLLPTAEHFQSIRSSRGEVRNTPRAFLI